MMSLEKCPQVDVGQDDRGSSLIFSLSIPDPYLYVEQCSKLFRQGSSRLLFGSNLAYHDNFVITVHCHWPR